MAGYTAVVAGLLPALASLGWLMAGNNHQGSAPDPALRKAADTIRSTLRHKHGEEEGDRIDQGVSQVLRLWRTDDGDPAAFARFCDENFLPRGAERDATFERLEFALERMEGYFTSMVRDLRRGADLDIGPLLPIDRRLAAFNPGAHLDDDLFRSKLALLVLLNFPITTLEERLAQGDAWSRRQWAEARLAERFASRVPAAVSQALTAATASADAYINAYNIYMHHVVDSQGKRLFLQGLRLIAHWGLRDELKARYADPDGLAKQRLIQNIMERIIRQEIPKEVIDNPRVDWDPSSNRIMRPQAAPAPAAGMWFPAPREENQRYRHWLAIFHAEQQADPYFPDDPTLMDRRFNIDREIPESDVETLLRTVLASPLGESVAHLVEKRLGRPLEPFDIWYAGFKSRGTYTEADLDARTRRRYPTTQAYAADIPRLLAQLGFSAERARFLADHIIVDPSRGAGHAYGAARRDDRAHLRTRVGAEGMDYKGYNIAVHEMGHNVEQVFSMTTIDHTLLAGVPNTAFTEALAFVFQDRDLELLDLESADAQAEHLEALETFWSAREIAGVALVDMQAWHWLYDHPRATPASFREAVVGIAQDIWNQYYAGLFTARDVPLLAVYSHMVDSALYTPDYPLGHLIAFQIEQHFRQRNVDFGSEFERLCRLGRLTPDAWMRRAVGTPLSAQPLLSATRRALEAMP
ncbi:MAG: hypothetical protein ACE5HD_06615 [Acidobacteriota bacterium]